MPPGEVDSNGTRCTNKARICKSGGCGCAAEVGASGMCI